MKSRRFAAVARRPCRSPAGKGGRYGRFATLRAGSAAALVLVLLFVISFAPRASARDSRFFSYQRFFPNQRFVKSIPDNGQLSRSVRSFAVDITDGLYAYSAGEYDEALALFIAARSSWPEFFGTDFLIALAYEQKGDYAQAARYYRGYLEKLRRFHEGDYGISGRLIYGITTFDIEHPDEAYDNVKRRMLAKGIDIDEVSAKKMFPTEFLPYIVAVFLIAVYMLIGRVVVPFSRKWYRMKFPPEGFWTCPRCGTYNPELGNECKECRMPKRDNYL